MRKIRLDLEQLSVDSFATVASIALDRGTVYGRDVTQAGEMSCGATCPNFTCGVSCQISCLNRCSGDTCDVPVCMV